jgi:hypothetical protein
MSQEISICVLIKPLNHFPPRIEENLRLESSNLNIETPESPETTVFKIQRANKSFALVTGFFTKELSQDGFFSLLFQTYLTILFELSGMNIAPKIYGTEYPPIQKLDFMDRIDFGVLIDYPGGALEHLIYQYQYDKEIPIVDIIDIIERMTNNAHRNKIIMNLGNSEILYYTDGRIRIIPSTFALYLTDSRLAVLDKIALETFRRLVLMIDNGETLESPKLIKRVISEFINKTLPYEIIIGEIRSDCRLA